MDSICTENKLIQQEEEEEEEEEEALSLCDLPINDENQSRKEELSSPRKSHESQDDPEFDFCSFSKESEMCAADEVFYRGQILPLRNSVSSEKGHCISRCASMDCSYSTGFSSRSSSIRSLQSSTSSSGSGSWTTNTTTTTVTVASKSINSIPRSRNQFHSHPSPTPQLRFSSVKHRNVHQSTRSNSSIWRIFQVGLVAPPEIALRDLRIRRDNNNNNSSSSSKLGRRNSSSSTSSDFSVSGNKKEKTRFFDKNGVLFGGCKCSANAADTINPKVVFIKRSASENETTNKQQQHRTRKQAFSRHRTFEWLKQLSLESATESDDALLPM